MIKYKKKAKKIVSSVKSKFLHYKVSIQKDRDRPKLPWKGSPTQLRLLLKILKDEKQIHLENVDEALYFLLEKYYFPGKEKEYDILNKKFQQNNYKIVWLGRTNTAAYLINKLIEKNLLSPYNHYKIFQELFSRRGKNFNNRCLSNSYRNIAAYYKEDKPIDAYIIDDLVDKKLTIQ